MSSGKIFDHKTMQVNYTTYDMRREYDIINPSKHADVMTVALDFDESTRTSPSGHPFRYAKVLGIYHTDAIVMQPGEEVYIETVEFLWVHWYQYDCSHKAGFQQRRLHRLELKDVNDPDAFGFLNPDDVIRGVHLIPAFAHGSYPTAASVSGTEADSPQGPVVSRLYYINL